ncbi:MAG: hypothetical protein OXE53_04470, partial [Deltaproteobacteria bacterium]|nr:hypothetical protein [Deltaproteobacteria bacterium]
MAAVSPFAAAPAEAQSRVLVSNIGQEAVIGARVLDAVWAQGFTTGSNSAGYLLTSIEVGIHLTVQQPSRVRAELWSAAANGRPNQRVARLMVPSSLPTGTATFSAPAGTSLLPNTLYFMVIGRAANVDAGSLGDMGGTSSNAEETRDTSAWSIANNSYYRFTNSSGGFRTSWESWDRKARIRVNGAETPKTWGATFNTSSTFPGSVTTVGVTLSEPAPAGGVTFFLTPRLGTDIPTGLCTGRGIQAATRENLGASLPSTLRVPAGRREAEARFPLSEDGYLVGGPGRCFAVTMRTDAPGWSLDGQSSTEVSVDPGDGFVAFGNNARNSNRYVASVAENVSGGTLNVPVTVNRLPVRSTDIVVEVVTAATTAAAVNFRLENASVTFGPRDTSLTQNIAVTVV